MKIYNVNTHQEVINPAIINAYRKVDAILEDAPEAIFKEICRLDLQRDDPDYIEADMAELNLSIMLHGIGLTLDGFDIWITHEEE